MDKPKRKYPLTRARVLDAVERSNLGLDDPGFCIVCGNEQGGCEPDARRYTCDACGQAQVFGAEELLFLLMI
jgi:hypothetical protein